MAFVIIPPTTVAMDSENQSKAQCTRTALVAGAQLGPYVIESLLGAGGMGQVFRGRDTRLGRAVAIKVSHEQFSARFEREARAISALNHPHICTLYDVGPKYLVMEFVEGAPLKGPLAEEKAVEYAGQILDALDAAHRKGIVHRDLKPANILVTRQGVKVLDFGLAHMEDGDQTLTLAGAVMGTPSYMAPEQWQGKPADARSDIFGFGCVFFEMLTGQRVSPDRRPLKSAVHESLVSACLATDPEDRWQSASDIRRALSLPAQNPSNRSSPSRRWWGATVALLVAGALGDWALSRRPPEASPVIRYEVNPPERGSFIFGISFNAGGVAAAPDARAIAYVASVNGKIGLWVQTLDSVAPRLLPGTADAQYPFWSPNGKSIAFFSGKRLLRVDPAAGAPLVICELGISPAGGAWLTEGEILIGAADAGLLHVSATGGTPAPLASPKTSAAESFPQALPGGRFLYMNGTRGNAQTANVYIASLARPNERTQLLAGAGSALYAPGARGKHYLLWLRESTLLGQELDLDARKLLGEPTPVVHPVISIGGAPFVTVSNGLLVYGTSNLTSRFTWFDRDGRETATVGETGEYNSFRLAPGGRRAVVSRNRPDGSDLWLLDTERGAFDRITSAAGIAAYPVWSPDAHTLVFSCGTPLSLFRVPSSGAGPSEQISSAKFFELATDWSPDGQYLVYFQIGAGTQEDTWYQRMTLDGRPAAAEQPKVYLNGPSREFGGRFSPAAVAGRWLAYQSDRSGQMEVYIDSFPQPRQAVRISTAGGLYPQWGQGGRELFYISPDYKLMAVTLKTSFNSIEPSQPRELFMVPAAVTNWSPFEAAPDGRFLVRAAGGQGPPLHVVLNWETLLKSGVAANSR